MKTTAKTASHRGAAGHGVRDRLWPEPADPAAVPGRRAVQRGAARRACPAIRAIRSRSLLTQFEKDLAAGVRQFLLFPVPAQKSNRNFAADFVGTALQQMRQRAGNDAAIWVDTCLCSFTETGHCCVHDARGRQDLAATHSALAALGLTYVKAGADGISPSDMNDGRVAHLRATLDGAGFDLAPIMSYSTKFASNFYGPFRDAADSAPQFGDRKSYQLDVRNRSDALASSRRCAEEGADLLMVKPGQPSADLIRPIHEQTGSARRRLPGERRIHLAGAAGQREFVNFDAALHRELVQPAPRRRQLHHHLRRAPGARPGVAALMRYFPLFLDIDGQAGAARGRRGSGCAQVSLVGRCRGGRSPSSRRELGDGTRRRAGARSGHASWRASSPRATSKAPGWSSPPRMIAP